VLMCLLMSCAHISQLSVLSVEPEEMGVQVWSSIIACNLDVRAAEALSWVAAMGPLEINSLPFATRV